VNRDRHYHLQISLLYVNMQKPTDIVHSQSDGADLQAAGVRACDWPQMCGVSHHVWDLIGLYYSKQ